MFGLKYVTQEMLKIEENKESFLGMDGGNIESDTWFCGVEFGGSTEQMSTYYENYIKFYKKGPFEIPYRLDCPDFFINSTFDRFLTAMYLNLFKNFKFTNTIDTSLISDVLKNELYNKNSKIFKLNLFPIAKENTYWDNKLTEELGYDKNVYYNSLFSKRIVFFKKLVSQFKPKNIICFSPSGYTDYFIRAFINKRQTVNYSWDYFTNENGNEFKISIFETSDTKVIIIPFLGRGNLNSYKNVNLMTNYLKKEYL